MVVDEIQELKRRIMKLESLVIDIYDATVEKRKECPICNSNIRLYLPFGETLRNNAACPVCGSLERHRAFWLYLKGNTELFNLNRNIQLLHFAPEKMFYNVFIYNESINYYPVDFNPDYFGIRDVVDITQIQYESEKFDYIICNHVMEHIVDDMKAFQESYRVLKTGGVAYINVPYFKELEKTFENQEYNTPELRSKYFGQWDHVRKYGKDFVQRVESAGFKVKVIKSNEVFTPEEEMQYGLNSEVIFECVK